MAAPPRIKVWSPKEPKKESPVVFARLVEILDGVEMDLVNADGIHILESNLLRVTSEGLYRVGCINPDIGLSLDSKGRLKLAGE
jgi:hypothetical protein